MLEDITIHQTIFRSLADDHKVSLLPLARTYAVHEVGYALGLAKITSVDKEYLINRQSQLTSYLLTIVGFL